MQRFLTIIVTRIVQDKREIVGRILAVDAIEDNESMK